MQLDSYLAARGESNKEFAARCGVSSRTIARVRAGDGCRLELAARIVQETFANPAPGGGSVALDDLVAGLRAGAKV